MYQISSSKTLVVKIFLPAFWITFFLAFTVAVLFSDKATIGDLPVGGLRLGSVMVLLSGIFVFYKTIFPLKRLDIDEGYVYVSNYLKTVRYSILDVEKIEVSKSFLFTFGTLVLKGEASFGREIRFLVSRVKLRRGVEGCPEWGGLVHRV